MPGPNAPSPFFHKLPRELILEVSAALPFSDLFVCANTCDGWSQAIQSHSLLAQKARQAGLANQVNLVIADTETGSQPRQVRIRERIRKLNNLFVSECALRNDVASRLARPAFAERAPRTLPLLTKPPRSLAGLMDYNFTADTDSIHCFSTCGKFQICASQSEIAILSLASGVPRCVLTFAVPYPPVRLAMDTSQGLYNLAVLTSRKVANLASTADSYYDSADEWYADGWSTYDEDEQLVALYDLSQLLQEPNSRTGVSQPVSGIDRTIEGVTFLNGNSAQSYSQEDDYSVAFGPVQTWIEQCSYSRPTSPYARTFPHGPNQSLSTPPPPIPCQVVRVNSSTPVKALAICPRTGAVALGSRSGTTLYWHDSVSNTHQVLTSNRLSSADHVSFVPQTGLRVAVLTSTDRFFNPFDSVFPVRFKNVLDVKHAHWEGSVGFVPIEPAPGLGEANEFTNVVTSAVAYPLSDGVHAVYLTKNESRLVIADCVNSQTRRPVMELKPPAGISAPVRLVSAGHSLSSTERVLALHGDHLVLYSIPSLNQLTTDAESASIEGSAVETGLNLDEIATVAEGVLIGKAPRIRSATVTINPTGEMFVWAASDGKIKAWRFAGEKFGVIRDHDQLRAATRGVMFDDDEGPSLLPRHIDALDLGL